MKKCDIFVLFVLIASLASAQIKSEYSDSNKISSLSRLKLSAGYFEGPFSEKGEGSFMFLNLNYRATELNKEDTPFSAGWFFEGGVNMVYIFPVLYGETGPEMKILKNFIAGANIGVLGIPCHRFSFTDLTASIW